MGPVTMMPPVPVPPKVVLVARTMALWMVTLEAPFWRNCGRTPVVLALKVRVPLVMVTPAFLKVRRLRINSPKLLVAV